MIEIRRLKSGYGDGAVLQAEYLKLECGKIVSLIGPNGSGKSTLLRAIAGLLPYEGDILIDGKQNRDYKRMERAGRVAYLPQILTNVNISVETLAEHGRYPHHGNMRQMTGHDRDVVAHALESVGLLEYRTRSLQELSGGERQRAYLAMVIAQDTGMILLDEPATYMDISHQHMFYEILKQLAKEGRGIVIASHDLPQSFTYSDEICMVHDGFVTGGVSPDAAIGAEWLPKVFGVGIRGMQEKDALYPYLLTRV